MHEELPMHDTYQDHYRRLASSAAFSKYCELTFGVDLSQDGFSDKAQLDLMTNFVGITKADHCLDLGCGNGKIAAYVALRTGASIDGIDYSSEAIACAKGIAPRRGALHFELGEINALDLPTEKYSVIYLVDTIYFSNDYELMRRKHGVAESLRSDFEREGNVSRCEPLRESAGPAEPFEHFCLWCNRYLYRIAKDRPR
jgi:SAM-dependent methyltransferase